jgi:hypothetical protein
MASNRKPRQIPPVAGWGGTRSIQRRLERSATLVGNREAISYEMISMVRTNFTDIASWDGDGKVTIKASDQIPEYALSSIKSIKARTDRDGNSTLEVELYDKVALLRLLAKASGLLDAPDDSDKPSVIGINVQPPDVVDVKDENVED